MNRPFEVHLPQDKIALRRVLFAIELLDSVTLECVSQGVEVIAHGLQGKPIVNASGLFVWLKEDISQLEKISISPGTLPYEEAEIQGEELEALRKKIELQGSQLHTLELPPRVDYPFSAGITGLRGTLVEAPHEDPPRPVPEAEVRLRWFDEFSTTWHDAPTKSHTTAKGDFVAILRLTRSDNPQLETGNLTVRLRVKRGNDERSSEERQVLQGRISNPSAQDKYIFAWDVLQR